MPYNPYPRYTLEQLQTALDQINARHYFNWSTADQVDRLLIQREIAERTWSVDDGTPPPTRQLASVFGLGTNYFS